MNKIISLIIGITACFVVFTGCEKSGSDDSSGSSSSVVGHWKVTHFVDPISKNDDTNTGFYWHFNDDGTCSLNNSSTTHGHRTGTYKVSGNKITGSGTNPGVGSYDINFTVEGNSLSGGFVEHWGDNKTIAVVAVKQ